MQSLKKINSWFQKLHEKQMNLNASSGKSENLHFDVLLLSTAYKFLAKKIHLSWHWRMI